MHKRMLGYVGLLILMLPFVVQAQDSKIKNIIFMIGDGMGLAQVSAMLEDHPDSVLKQFPVVGLVENKPVDGWVTDSAAAATALATGNKVKNGVLSLSASGQPLKTLLEYAKEQGKATGMITTCEITNATPAAFFAHVSQRAQYERIAEYLPESQLDLYFGGGWAYFIPSQSKGSRRKDNRDLLLELEKKTYWILQDIGALASVEATDRPILGFFAPEALPQAHHRSFTSAELTSKALAWLPARSEKGFVLMIEGSQIDWACHQNDTQDLLAELSDFNGAIQAAWTFVQSHPETLLVVTADHETGAVFLAAGASPKVEQHVRFSNHDHSGIMIPVFAAGTGSEAFAGVYSNSDLGKKMIALVNAN